MMPDDDGLSDLPTKDTRNKHRGYASGDHSKRTNAKEIRVRQEKMQNRLEQSEMMTNHKAAKAEADNFEEMQRQHQKKLEQDQKKKEQAQRREENKNLYDQDLINIVAGSVPTDLQGKKARIYNQRVESVQNYSQQQGKPKINSNQRASLLQFMQNNLK
mmetsp:Transcript_27683/g.27379  ORF Transcript_27683/g.27379 Transcript_27683/m.27379 type:complete len:159 (+) Transcript_27683:51-527(+)